MGFLRAVAALCLISQAALALTPSEIELRKETKNTAFSNLAFLDANNVKNGLATAKFDFTASDSLFMHFEVPSSKVEAFAEHINLPEEFTLAKVNIVAYDRPLYYLTANAYTAKIGTVVTLTRLEFSTYVTTEDDDTPYFMVLEGYGQDGDSTTDVLTGELGGGSSFTYTRNTEFAAGHVAVEIDESDVQFKVSFTAPKSTWWNQQRISKTIQDAGSRNYFLNGVADNSYSNEDQSEARVTRVRRRAVRVEIGHTKFAPFIKKKPRHVYLLGKPVTYIVETWYNIYDENLLTTVDASVLAKLQTEMRDTFSGLGFLAGSQIANGNAEGLAGLAVDEQPPAIFINWKVPWKNLAKFKEQLNLPKGLKLAKQKCTTGSERPAYMLSLNVYQSDAPTASGPTTGFRAEWSTYVTSEDDGHRKPYFLVVDVAASLPSLDVISLYTLAAEEFVYEEVSSSDVVAPEPPCTDLLPSLSGLPFDNCPAFINAVFPGKTLDEACADVVVDPETGAGTSTTVLCAKTCGTCDPDAVSPPVDAGGEQLLVTKVVSGDLSFTASFPMPDISQCTEGMSYNFVRSNSRIYWGDTNVYDRGFYLSDEAFNAKITTVDPARVTVTDGTRWAGIVEDKPFQTFAICSSIRYLVQPWYNIEEVAPTEEDPVTAPGVAPPSDPPTPTPCSGCCDFVDTANIPGVANCAALFGFVFGGKTIDEACADVVEDPATGTTTRTTVLCAKTCGEC